MLKTIILTSASTGVKILAGLAGNKIVALYLGPAGLAQLGQFANLVSILSALSGGGVALGVTRHIAASQANKSEVAPLLGAALGISLLSSVLVAMAILIFRDDISRWLPETERRGALMLVLAGSVFFMSLHGLLAAMLNGYKEIRLLVTLNMATSLIGLLLLVMLTTRLGLNGALLAILLTPMVSFLGVLLYFLARKAQGVVKLFRRPDLDGLRKLSHFMAMAVVSALALPLATLFIRDFVGQSISWQAAGYWQGMWKISDAYLLLVTTSLGVYYLPRLSEIQAGAELRREIFRGYKTFLPLAAIGAVSIYFMREWIIRVLFSEAFMPMSELFAFQLVGDVLKIGAWLLAYLMLAKVMPRLFILTEIAFSLCFTACSVWFVGQFGLVGLSYAFALSYLLYWLALAALMRKVLFFADPEMASS